MKKSVLILVAAFTFSAFFTSCREDVYDDRDRSKVQSPNDNENNLENDIERGAEDVGNSIERGANEIEREIEQ